MSNRFPDAEVAEFADPKLKSPTVIAGFVGAGLAGPIAAGHIISQTSAREFACMRSRHLPPAAVFIRGHLQHPFRFYSHAASDTCVIICETTIHMDGVYDIISAIFDWIRSRNAQRLIILDGIAGESHDGVAYYAAEEGGKVPQNATAIPRGFLTGISGGLLDECLLHDVCGSALLARASGDSPDPLAAATLVEAANSMCNLGVDAAPLRAQSEQIGHGLSELSRKYTSHRDEARGMYM